MLSPSDFHDIVSGRRRGASATMVRAGLAVAEIPYRMAVRFRNLRYDRGHSEIHRVDVPVISVGNLTLGGTGKTPMVAWLVEWFLKNEITPAIVSRGYGSRNGEQNDEARELAKRFPAVRHVQNPNRVAGARLAIADNADKTVDVLIMDDGFQHRRLHRDLDIVLIDALQPFGFGRVFPRGSLREPLEGIARADIAILTRADTISDERKSELREFYRNAAPDLMWLESASIATRLVNHSGQTKPLSFLDGKKVLGFCAIGNPSGFEQTLDSVGCIPETFMEFPDHHNYDSDDLVAIESATRDCGANLAVCTCKDLAKLEADRIGGNDNGEFEVYALEISTNVQPTEPLSAKLAELMKGPA